MYYNILWFITLSEDQIRKLFVCEAYTYNKLTLSNDKILDLARLELLRCTMSQNIVFTAFVWLCKDSVENSL